MLPDVRHAHPYYMYDEMIAQPTYLRQLLARRTEVEPVAAALADRRRILLTGCGTSFHAAMAGAAIAQQFFGAQTRAQAVPAFELISHRWEPGPDDAVVAFTHAGDTPMTLEALKRARVAGSSTVTITGFPESRATRDVDHIVWTGYAIEQSWAHTISYTLSATAAYLLFGALAVSQQVDGAAEMLRQAEGLPEQISAILDGALSSQVRDLAAELVDRRLWIVAGSGPGLPVAHETALKAAETHYVPAVGMDLEQVLHGYLPMCDAGTLLIIAAPPPQTVTRTGELLRAAQRIGITTLLLSAEPIADQPTRTLILPPCAEALYPIAYAVPLHLLCYHVALAKGLNPDLIRRDEPAYREARACYV
jgi:glucosamine--fructose-6-phosphate aminotransferase (isomerizing)